jgi:hypothetical protein
VSGKKKTFGFCPNSSSKKFYPYKNYLAIDSPEGILPSNSTHVPPTTSNNPSFTASFNLK